MGIVPPRLDEGIVELDDDVSAGAGALVVLVSDFSNNSSGLSSFFGSFLSSSNAALSLSLSDFDPFSFIFSNSSFLFFSDALLSSSLPDATSS